MEVYEGINNYLVTCKLHVDYTSNLMRCTKKAAVETEPGTLLCMNCVWLSWWSYKHQSASDIGHLPA